MRKWRLLVGVASVLAAMLSMPSGPVLAKSATKARGKVAAKPVVCRVGYSVSDDVTRLAADLDGDGSGDCVEAIVTLRDTPGRQMLRVRFSSGGSSQIVLPFAWVLDGVRTTDPKLVWLRDGSPYPNSPGQVRPPDSYRLLALRGKRLATVPDNDGVLVNAESAWFSCSANGDVLRHSAVHVPSRLRVWTQRFSTGSTTLQAVGPEVLSETAPPPGDGCGIRPANLASVFRPQPAKCAAPLPTGVPSERVIVNGRAVDVSFPPSEPDPNGPFVFNEKPYAEPGDHDVVVRFDDGTSVNLGLAASFGVTDIHAAVWGAPGREKLVVRSANEFSKTVPQTRSFQLYTLAGCSSRRLIGPQRGAFTLQSSDSAFNRSFQQFEQSRQNWRCDTDGVHIRSYGPHATSVFTVSDQSLEFQADEPGGVIADSTCANDSPNPSVTRIPVPRSVRPELVVGDWPEAKAEVAEMNAIAARASERCLSIGEVRNSVAERLVVTPQPVEVAEVISELKAVGSRPITVVDATFPTLANQPVRSTVVRPSVIEPSPNPSRLSWETSTNGRSGTATLSIGPLTSGIGLMKSGTASLSVYNTESLSWEFMGSAVFDLLVPGEARDPTACPTTWSSKPTGYTTVFPVERPVPKGSVLSYSFPFPELRPAWYQVRVPFGVVTFQVK